MNKKKTLLSLWRFLGNGGLILGAGLYDLIPNDPVQWFGPFGAHMTGWRFILLAWYFAHGEISGRVFYLVRPKWYSVWQYPTEPVWDAKAEVQKWQEKT